MQIAPLDLDAVTCAYLAGLIDGEGYIGITRSHAKSAKACKRGISYRLLVAVQMTDRRPLDFAARATGNGRVLTKKKYGRYRQAWGWQVWSRQAAALLRTIRPHLLVKGEVADLCIEFQSIMVMPGRLGLSDQAWAERERLWKATKEINSGKAI